MPEHNEGYSVMRGRFERGQRNKADADDACYATFQLEGGIVAQINSSWTTRVNRAAARYAGPSTSKLAIPGPARPLTSLSERRGATAG